MEVNPNWLSPCGLYCGVCAIRIAHRDGNVKLKEKLAALYRGDSPGKGALPNSEWLTVADIHCDGCLSDDRFLHCRQCDIRNCCQERGISGCHLCEEFPCSRIEDFPMTVGKRVILRAVPYRKAHGDERWAVDEEARYHCPDCGAPAFRGAMRCSRCKRELDLD